MLKIDSISVHKPVTTNINMIIRRYASKLNENVLAYLDVLEIEFKLIALSETAINSTHAIYNIPNYNIEMNYRERK